MIERAIDRTRGVFTLGAHVNNDGRAQTLLDLDEIVCRLSPQAGNDE
jgi:hypothetical protein